jgi:hypothetical protein
MKPNYKAFFIGSNILGRFCCISLCRKKITLIYFQIIWLILYYLKNRYEKLPKIYTPQFFQEILETYNIDRKFTKSLVNYSVLIFWQDYLKKLSLVSFKTQIAYSFSDHIYAVNRCSDRHTYTEHG